MEGYTLRCQTERAYVGEVLMKILFISKLGNSLPLAQRVQEEGHSTFFFIVDEKARRVGNGVVDKPNLNLPIINKGGHPVQTNLNQLLSKVSPDFVIFDSTGLGRVADTIRSNGTPILGGCRWADVAELDRDYGRKLMKQVGILPLPSPQLKSEGVEVGCEMWWNGLHSTIHSVSFTDARFMNDSIGPNVGCAGTVVKMIPYKSKLVKEGVGRMERLLKKTTYRGPISLDMFVTEGKLYGLKFTVGFNYDNIQALLVIHKGSITELLHSVVNSGKDDGEFTSDYAISVRLSIPPYPHTDLVEGVKVSGVNSSNEKHVWWSDIMREGGELVSAGASGVPLVVTARGRDVVECRRRVYRTVNNIIVKDVQYRTDIGDRVVKDEKKLKSWGYL